MGGTSVVEFERALGKGVVPAVVLFVGEEARLVDRGLARLREAVVPAAQRDFNEDRLRADDLDAPRLEDSLRTLPVLGGRRLVIVRDAHRLEDRGARCEAMQAALVAYVEAPVETTVLALAAEKVDRRLKVWKAVEKVGVVVDCGPPDEATLPARLEAEAAAAGVRFEPGAARFLVELAGHDLGVLEGEVAKLAAFVGEGGRITAESVRQMLESRRAGETSVFEWVDAVAARRTDDALTGLARLLDAGEEPLRLLALLARQVRLVLATRSMLARGASTQEVAERVVPRARFLARKLVDQARQHRDRDLFEMHDALVEADLALKSSPASQRFVMERLVLALCRPRTP
ncbi:MAG TPA: DNA polymerase III subunit delta [Thermodesulfobacteriota bacterium]